MSLAGVALAAMCLCNGIILLGLFLSTGREWMLCAGSVSLTLFALYWRGSGWFKL